MITSSSIHSVDLLCMDEKESVKNPEKAQAHYFIFDYRFEETSLGSAFAHSASCPLRKPWFPLLPSFPNFS